MEHFKPKKNNKTKKLFNINFKEVVIKYRKKQSFYIFLLIILVLIFVLYLAGYSSYAINSYPIVPIGKKTTTLSCNYAGKKLSTQISTYANVNNYYHYNVNKNAIMNTGNFSKLVYTHPLDSTIKTLTKNIQDIATKNNFSTDQAMELATCMVQNIPYDDKKASQVLDEKSQISSKDIPQYPYETIFKNSGICTDKTYLSSAILREMGYGTSLLVFPDSQHMALGVSAPSGYTDFNTNYLYLETTTTGFIPGDIPDDINNNNGKPSLAINQIADLDTNTDPNNINFDYKKTISSPNLVIKISDGKAYNRIVAIRNLETKIYALIDNLTARKSVLSQAYAEMVRRDNYQKSTYSSYLATPSTRLDCGYKYNYSYSYSYSYSYPYTYRPPTSTYSCETVHNYRKDSAYSTYSYAFSSYKNQVNHYNSLIDGYNKQLQVLKTQVNLYKTYQYN